MGEERNPVVSQLDGNILGSLFVTRTNLKPSVMTHSEQRFSGKIKNPGIPEEEKRHGQHAHKCVLFDPLEHVNRRFDQKTQVSNRTSVAIKQIEMLCRNAPACNI